MLCVDRRLRKERAHASCDALVDAQKRGRVPRTAQSAHVGLGKTLVSLRESLWKRNVLDGAGPVKCVEGHGLGPFRLATGVDRGRCHRIEGRRRSGAEIENPRSLRVIEKVEIYRDD